MASELNPGNGDIDQELSSVRSQLRNKVAVAREGKTQLETLIERTRDLEAGGQRPARRRQAAGVGHVPRRQQPRRVHGAGAIRQRQRGLRPDRSATSRSRSTCATARWKRRCSRWPRATRSFYRVTAPRTITVVPDTPAKRREYEEEVLRTFYLSNADLKETLDLLRIVVDLRRVAAVAATNAISIKDTPERVAAAGRLIAAIDKARPEVVIDVELLEVDRTRLREYGLQLASPGHDRPDRHQRRRSRSTRPDDAARPAEPDAGERLPQQPAEPLLPAAQAGRQHAHAGQPAAADLGRHRRHGALRRARAGAGHDVRADRHRRRRPAADHVVQLREHRREHRHHAAHAPRRRGVAGAARSRSAASRARASAGCRRSATARSTR